MAARLNGSINLLVYNDTLASNNPKLRIMDISEVISDTSIGQFQPILIQIPDSTANQVIHFNSIVGEYILLISDQTVSVGVNFSGSITAIADYSGTVSNTVRVTSASHGRKTGEYLTLSGTNTYDGSYMITVIDANSYYITHAFAATSTGTWTSVGGNIPCKRMYIDGSSAASLTVSNSSGSVANLTLGFGK